MKKKCSILALILILSLLFSGCGAKSANDMAAATGGSNSYDRDTAAESVAVDKSMDYAFSTVESDIYENPDNKIIRTATMHIQTTEFDQAVTALAELTEANGGYYESAEMDGGSYYSTYANRSAYYVVRIPKENFIAFRNGTGGIGHVYSMVEGTQDVGETYYDTEARLNTLTTKRDRLLALLEEATEMEDIITLEDALADVLYEIDLHTATLRKYDSLVNFSTFTIYLNEMTKIVEEPKAEDSFGTKLLANLNKGFQRFGENVQDFILWFAGNLMGIVIFAAVAVFAVLFVRSKVRARRRRRMEREEQSGE